MSEGKHTPGPWSAVNDGTADEPMWAVKAARIAGKPPRHAVAICATGDSPQDMETANAAFIVKACNAYPKMVEALTEAKSVMLADLPAHRGLSEAAAERVFQLLLAALSSGDK